MGVNRFRPLSPIKISRIPIKKGVNFLVNNPPYPRERYWSTLPGGKYEQREEK